VRAEETQQALGSMLTSAHPESMHLKAHHPRTQEDLLQGNSPGDRESLGLLGGETFPVFSLHLYSPFTRVYSTQDDRVPQAEDTGVLVKMTYLFTAMLSKPVPTLTAIAVNI